MKSTIHDRLLAAFKARGWREVPSRSSKYTQLACAEHAACLFLGKNGALRVGRNVTDSRSAEGTMFYADALLEGTELLSPNGDGLLEALK